MGKSWTFQQLGGDRKTIELNGEAAPHGRPRRNPIVSDGIQLRKYRVRYPDQKGGVPTTHVFGTEHKDWELRGRFNDRYLGKGGCKAAIAAWLSLAADAQPVLITWGDVLSAHGWVDSFVPGRESEFESTYVISLLIDERPEITGPALYRTPSDQPEVLCGQLYQIAKSGIGNLPNIPDAGDLKPSFLDSIDNVVSSVNTFSASLLRIAQEFSDFSSATLDQLERLRAGVAQMRTAVLSIRTSLSGAENDAILIVRAADADVLWWKSRADLDVSSLSMLALLDEIDRQAEIGERGQVLTIYTARGGDTWESISTAMYGAADGAGRIRDANGVQYGELPVPGRSYQVPVPA